MANYAYLRVSTNQQDLENQKLSVLEYCAKEGINRPEMVEEKVTGTKSWKEREIGKILQQGQRGVTILFSGKLAFRILVAA